MAKENRLAFLESAGNLKPIIKAVTGRLPSTEAATEMAVCLQQGWLFYEAADSSALEIRPLLLFYGTMALSKAVVLMLSRGRMAALPQRHGVGDNSTSDSRLADTTVKVGGDGIFHRFNDVVAPRIHFHYWTKDAGHITRPTPAALSTALVDHTASLKDLLARLPRLESLYALTFREPARAIAIREIHEAEPAGEFWQLEILVEPAIPSHDDLKEMVQDLRQRFPMLQQWRLMGTERAGHFTQLYFANVAIPPNELEHDLLNRVRSYNQFRDLVPVDPVLSPIGGSIGRGRVPGQYLVGPTNGLDISEYGVHYLAAFLLSSVVRYRPQTWVHAIRRNASSTRSADDSMLALIEEFMSLHPKVMAELVTGLLNLDG